MKMKCFLRTSSCRSMLFLFALAFYGVMGATNTIAQSTGGRIRGTVTDATGGAVTGAKLSIINEANGQQRDADSGGNGEYIFLEVPVGTYDVSANQAGFKKYLRKGIVVNLNEVLNLDIVLQVGGSTETVEVTGAAPLVDTTSTQLGAVVGERAVSELPLAQPTPTNCCNCSPAFNRRSVWTQFTAVTVRVWLA